MPKQMATVTKTLLIEPRPFLKDKNKLERKVNKDCGCERVQQELGSIHPNRSAQECLGGSASRGFFPSAIRLSSPSLLTKFQGSSTPEQ